jgi:YbgC/YbaW family acyl-CoA thioester hydrolase
LEYEEQRYEMKENVVERRIMWGDMDPLGIVFYPRYYEWIDACGHLFFESIGLTLGDLWKERQLLFGLIETSCRYFQPGRYHESVQIITRIKELSPKILVLGHTIRATADKGIMVEGLEKRICMDVSDPRNLRGIDMPPDIYVLLEQAAK